MTTYLAIVGFLTFCYLYGVACYLWGGYSYAKYLEKERREKTK